jgi:hypothetical protein
MEALNMVTSHVGRSNGYSISTQKLNHKKWLFGLMAVYATGYIGALRSVMHRTSDPAHGLGGRARGIARRVPVSTLTGTARPPAAHGGGRVSAILFLAVPAAAAISCWEALRDKATTVYLYEGPPGLLLLVLNLVPPPTHTS